MANKLFDENKAKVMKRYEEIVSRKNIKSDFYNGIYDRYVYPVLTLSLIHISEPTRR